MTTKTIASIVLALILYAIASTETQAKTQTQNTEYDRHTGGYSYAPSATTKVARHVKRQHYRQRRDHIPHKYAARGEVQLLPHPTGCPSRAFCGCGASIEVFGRSIREAWVAAWWFRFPRAQPAPGMVAVRSHHVFVIREVRAPGLVLAYDANSGGHRTRIHLRSLAGYTVVNPRGSSYASAEL